MSNYDYAKQYENMRQEVYRNYGTEHLCGNCVYTTTCKRADIQALNSPEIKAGLIKKHAPFVKVFAIEELHRSQREVGFVAVYDCDRFLFDNPKGARICGMNSQYLVNQ
jgi:hypothetical protein